ncbi:ankyrin repeat domain-containing protein [Altererythrobacter sp. MF3-039]|uniref:ankyrin repeat domain-containing protein n=1 Tax=Altererythrobacter sp. MF3-039 TaxID=3252901 RepID=UPI00390CBEA9
MAQAVFRKVFIAIALAAGIVAAPAAAQRFSEGYEFLKAVKERDGTAATEMLNEPGTTVVNARDITSGESAMHIVTARRDVLWIRFLAQRGANPNIEDKRGNTPIQIAAQLGFVEGIEELVKAGARVDVTNIAGETPLISAIHRRDSGMVRLLLEKGADPDRADNSGRSARDYAKLMSNGSQVLGEIERADAKREADGGGESYGPSF